MSSNHLILCRHLILLPSIFPSIRVFSNGSVLCIFTGGQSSGASASTSVPPMNIQDWFPLILTDLISLQSKGLLRVFYNTTVKSINSLVLNFLYGPNLTSIHDYWENHNFDYTDLCRQSNVSAFNMLSRLVITFLTRSKHLLISWLQSPSVVIFGAQKNKVSHCLHGTLLQYSCLENPMGRVAW